MYGFASAFVVVSTLFLNFVNANNHGIPKYHQAHSSLHNSTHKQHRALQKRFENAKFTLYDAGLGACGGTNSDSDFIVALNIPQWDGGSHCGETISITCNGKTLQAQIVDECVGCPPDGLDFSRGLFSQFAPEGDGVIYGEWNFGGAPEQTTTTPKPKPTPEVKTTVHSTTRSTTISSTSISTSIISSTSVTSSSSSSTSASQTTSASASATSAPSVPEGPNTLGSLSQAMIQMAVLMTVSLSPSS